MGRFARNGICYLFNVIVYFYNILHFDTLHILAKLIEVVIAWIMALTNFPHTPTTRINHSKLVMKAECAVVKNSRASA